MGENLAGNFLRCFEDKLDTKLPKWSNRQINVAVINLSKPFKYSEPEFNRNKKYLSINTVNVDQVMQLIITHAPAHTSIRCTHHAC